MFGRILFGIVVITAMVVTTMGIGCGKKGVVVWAKDYRCGDFKAMYKYINWWYDYTCDMRDFYDDNNPICALEIGNYTAKYVPMQWGFYPHSNFQCWADFNPDYVLGVNEPNHVKQSNLLPSVAAAYWPHFAGNATGRAVIGPSAAPCSGNVCNEGGNTTMWLDQFSQLCDDCRIDFTATHTYWCNADKVMDFLEMLYLRYRKRIWLTEFACRHEHNNPDKVLKFMKEILPRLEGAFFVYRYAWYKHRISVDSQWVQSSASLFRNDTLDSELNDLGRYYFNATSG